jgi:hypothetical protein
MATSRHVRVEESSCARDLRTLLSAIVGRLLVLVVVAYQVVLSPVLPRTCRYTPSCSAYARQAIEKHGPAHGGWLAVRRLCRCHPFGGCGHDPVP